MVQQGIKSESGRVSRGWRRWVRARDAAYERPNTKHAKLYFNRRSVASNFRVATVDLRRHTKRWNNEVDFYTCSDFCAAMQAQIGYGRASSYESLQGALSNNPPIDPSELTRTITCHVCARKINPDGSTDSTNRVDFHDPVQKFEAPVRKERKPAPEPASAPVEFYRELADWEFMLLNPGSEVVYFDHNSKRVLTVKPNITEVRLTPDEARVFQFLSEDQKVAFIRAHKL